MRHEAELIERLRKITALFERPGTEGERAAAANALERVRERLQRAERAEPPVEYRFSMTNGWSRALLVALLRRYGIDPYRYKRQRRTTVMAKVSPGFVDRTLWPEFQELDRTLREHLDAVTRRIIREAVWEEIQEAEERPDAAPRELPGGDDLRPGGGRDRVPEPGAPGGPPRR